MVDEDSPADGGAGMDLHPGEPFAQLGKKTGRKKQPVQVTPMGHPVDHQGVKPRVEQQNLQRAAGGWVPLPDGIDVLAQTFEHSNSSLFSRW